MPYAEKSELLHKLNAPYPQFVVHDFDKDGIEEIFLNIDNPFSTIPKALKGKGLTASRILLDYTKGELIVKDYNQYTIK